MSPPAVANYLAGQFGDTTYTKVFVGGLAWETQRETMRNYFEQFGEILEAVVITDKNTGRSKGYGFVTYSEPEGATRACVHPSPVIDGRRANCNLASLGVQRSTPTTPQGGNRSFRVMKASLVSGSTVQSGGMGAAFPSPAGAALPHYAIQQGIPYNIYGYPPYSQDYSSYPTSYYNVYGGTASQYPIYGGGADGAFYPYFQFSSSQQGGGGGGGSAYGQGYSWQYPPQMFHYSSIATSSSAAITGGPVSFAPNPHDQSGVTMALAEPTLPAHYGLLSSYSLHSIDST